MSTTDHYESADLALFAMQLLPKPQHGSMTLHISDCPYCRQELAHLQGDLATYAYTVEMHSPPALARERLLHQIGHEKKLIPVDRIESAALPDRPKPAAEPGVEHRTRGQNYGTGLGSGRYLAEDEQPRSEEHTSELQSRQYLV